MPLEITVPRLGWSMEEAIFSLWLKKDGETVAPGDPLFTLESDKATQDVEAIDAGILRLTPDSPQTGDTVKAGQRIAFLLAPGESLDAPQPTPAAAQSPSEPSTRTDPTTPAILPASSALESGVSAAGGTTISATISPRARRLAGELGIDWTHATPTGSTGRIRERDIRVLAARSQTKPSSSAPASLRQRIAQRLVASLRESAPVTLFTTVDATALVALRSRFKSEATASQLPPPTITDLLLQLTARALREHPALNVRWEASGPVACDGIHLGLAVDTDAGLLVPVIHHADRLSLTEIARRTRDLAGRARQRTLTPDQLRGGTFTLTNLGTFGIDHFTPILNPPECGILGVGRIHRRPAVVGDTLVAQDQLSLSLTFDHRALDGAPAARFLQTLSHLIVTVAN